MSTAWNESVQCIYEACVELYNQEQPVTRYTVAELTGAQLAKVDDRLKYLVGQERLRRVLRGHYVPVEAHRQSRAISKTMLPSGLIKIEIGDDVLELTPKENRMLAQLMMGAATHVAQIEMNKNVSELMLALDTRVSRLEGKPPPDDDGQKELW